MKKLLFILLLCSFTVGAQIQEGTIVIGGNLNFGGNKENNDFFTSDYSSNRGSFNLGGSFEKFVNDKTAIGIGLSYSYNNFDYSGGYDYGRNQHLINVGAGISHYVPFVNKLYFTIDTYLFFGI